MDAKGCSPAGGNASLHPPGSDILLPGSWEPAACPPQARRRNRRRSSSKSSMGRYPGDAAAPGQPLAQQHCDAFNFWYAPGDMRFDEEDAMQVGDMMAYGAPATAAAMCTAQQGAGPGAGHDDEADSGETAASRAAYVDTLTFWARAGVEVYADLFKEPSTPLGAMPQPQGNSTQCHGYSSQQYK